MDIVLFGGSGTLGSELKKLNKNILCPTHKDVDIEDYETLSIYLRQCDPDIVINCAAKIDNREIQNNPIEALQTNIIGAANLAAICLHQKIRLVYISSDYVYSGEKGNYKENDPLLPVNLYAWTKLGGECSARCVPNYLIIRTSFGQSRFNHQVAWSNQYTSKDYVDVIAPMIYKAAISNYHGVMNIGTERKSMHQYAVKRNPDIEAIHSFVKDYSLDTTIFNKFVLHEVE